MDLRHDHQVRLLVVIENSGYSHAGVAHPGVKPLGIGGIACPLHDEHRECGYRPANAASQMSPWALSSVIRITSTA